MAEETAPELKQKKTTLYFGLDHNDHSLAADAERIIEEHGKRGRTLFIEGMRVAPNIVKSHVKTRKTQEPFFHAIANAWEKGMRVVFLDRPVLGRLLLLPPNRRRRLASLEPEILQEVIARIDQETIRHPSSGKTIPINISTGAIDPNHSDSNTPSPKAITQAPNNEACHSGSQTRGVSSRQRAAFTG